MGIQAMSINYLYKNHKLTHELTLKGSLKLSPALRRGSMTTNIAMSIHEKTNCNWGPTISKITHLHHIPVLYSF